MSHEDYSSPRKDEQFKLPDFCPECKGRGVLYQTGCTPNMGIEYLPGINYPCPKCNGRKLNQPK
ncbi:MAG: hypothetical protein WC139_12865 [Candidatus Kapaibacterium sp.]